MEIILVLKWKGIVVYVASPPIFQQLYLLFLGGRGCCANISSALLESPLWFDFQNSLIYFILDTCSLCSAYMPLVYACVTAEERICFTITWSRARRADWQALLVSQRGSENWVAVIHHALLGFHTVTSCLYSELFAAKGISQSHRGSLCA